MVDQVVGSNMELCEPIEILQPFWKPQEAMAREVELFQLSELLHPLGKLHETVEACVEALQPASRAHPFRDSREGVAADVERPQFWQATDKHWHLAESVVSQGQCMEMGQILPFGHWIVLQIKLSQVGDVSHPA